MPSSVDPVAQLNNATLAKPRTANSELGEVDFMKLIIAQMRNQNPLEPQKDSDFMAQMAQFEALSQMKAMAAGMKTLQAVNELSSAAGMIGRSVIGKQVDATSVTRDQVARANFGTSFDKLTSDQKVQVTSSDEVKAAIADAKNAGKEVAGKVQKVVVGADGIPMVVVGGKVVDMFTVSEVTTSDGA
jgi:flagellar basal-body rod modification protein FlgD